MSASSSLPAADGSPTSLRAVADVVRAGHLFVPECKLVSGDFAIAVQLGLGLAAASTLLYKRFVDAAPRSWLIWGFDASKQAFSGVMQHVAGISFGISFASGGEASACSWYFVIFCISTVTSLTWLWFAMRTYTYVVERNEWTLLYSGEYGNPPSWKPWLAQILLLGVIVAVEKVLTAVFIIEPLYDSLDAFAAWAERPLIDEPNLELLIVMVFGPMLLNAFFFWIADNLVAAPLERRDSSLRNSRTSSARDTSAREETPRGSPKSAPATSPRWTVHPEPIAKQTDGEKQCEAAAGMGLVAVIYCFPLGMIAVGFVFGGVVVLFVAALVVLLLFAPAMADALSGRRARWPRVAVDGAGQREMTIWLPPADRAVVLVLRRVCCGVLLPAHARFVGLHASTQRGGKAMV